MNTATLFACVSILTGYPIPESPVHFVEMPTQIIVDEAMKRGLPDALYTKALYFGLGYGAPGIVWHGANLDEKFIAHEITHHFQEQAAAPLDFWGRERQADCVEVLAKWCGEKPLFPPALKGACHAAQ